MMKKKIKIAHLYYDLMNLYGENGNIKAFETFIQRQGIETEVDKLSINDKIDYKKYDIFYLGGGMEECEYMVLSDLFHYKDDIKDAIEAGKLFLVTGNAMELFGTKKKLKNGKNIECLGIFDFNSVEANSRLVSELFYEFSTLPIDKGRNLIGFKNCDANIVNNSGNRIFKFPDNINYKNFYGMMFVGPVLIRNPYFTNYILQNFFEDNDLPFEPVENTEEFRAYHEFVNNFIINRNLD